MCSVCVVNFEPANAMQAVRKGGWTQWDESKKGVQYASSNTKFPRSVVDPRLFPNGSDPVPFRIQDFVAKICEILKLHIFYAKNCNLYISMLPWKMSKVQETPSTLKREHPALQNMKFLHFSYSIFVGYFFPTGSGSGSSRPNLMRIRIHNTAYTYSVVQPT